MSGLKNFDFVTIPVTPLEQNCRILFVSSSQTTDAPLEGRPPEAIIIDPGGDFDKIESFLSSRFLNLKSIWLTHSHFDHCGAVTALQEKYHCELYGHRRETEFRTSVEVQAGYYGLQSLGLKNCPEPTRYFVEGDILSFNDRTFEVLFTPGHSPGHLSFHCREESLLFSGDTLFSGSIGRTDLPQGNSEILLKSIKNQLLVLPEDTVVLSGHGPATTIGKEMRTNPFLVE